MHWEVRLHPRQDCFCPGHLVAAQGRLPSYSGISRALNSQLEAQNMFKSRRDVV